MRSGTQSRRPGSDSAGLAAPEFETRVRQLVAGDQLIASLIDCMVRVRKASWQDCVRLHEVVLAIVRQDELCRRFMRVPGAGPISALSWQRTKTKSRNQDGKIKGTTRRQAVGTAWLSAGRRSVGSATRRQKARFLRVLFGTSHTEIPERPP
jgi:hypothetical protein